MADEKKKVPTRAQNIFMENRAKMSVSGVTDIESFDEQNIVLYTDLGLVVIRGEGLHISRIDLDSGELALDGMIGAVSYEDNYSARSSLFSRMFR